MLAGKPDKLLIWPKVFLTDGALSRHLAWTKLGEEGRHVYGCEWGPALLSLLQGSFQITQGVLQMHQEMDKEEGGVYLLADGIVPLHEAHEESKQSQKYIVRYTRFVHPKLSHKESGYHHQQKEHSQAGKNQLHQDARHAYNQAAAVLVGVRVSLGQAIVENHGSSIAVAPGNTLPNGHDGYGKACEHDHRENGLRNKVPQLSDCRRHVLGATRPQWSKSDGPRKNYLGSKSVLKNEIKLIQRINWRRAIT